MIFITVKLPCYLIEQRNSVVTGEGRFYRYHKNQSLAYIPVPMLVAPRNGQGKILTPDELRLLFTEGLRSERDRALFGICLFTGCRVSEALSLQTTDIRGGALTFRKSTTKGKLKTRVVDIQPGLAQLLAEYQPSKSGALFPGMRRRAPTLTRFTADKILKAACERVGLEGVSTHSFRRTALTMMSSAGIPLRVIQEVSGHNDLGTLQRYLEVSPEQKRRAVSVIRF